MPSSSSRGIRNCFELKSPTVRLRICRPSPTSARTSPAILRMAELRSPSARCETRVNWLGMTEIDQKHGGEEGPAHRVSDRPTLTCHVTEVTNFRSDACHFGEH